jgi:hypothetical protein
MRLDHLPLECWTVNADGQCVMIVRGKMGYFIMSDGGQEQADNFNQASGVEPEEIDIMVGGSMFGWDTPLVQNYKPSNIVDEIIADFQF